MQGFVMKSPGSLLVRSGWTEDNYYLGTGFDSGYISINDKVKLHKHEEFQMSFFKKSHENGTAM